MQWEIVIALVIAIPIILFPVALIWYINFGGIVAVIKRAREKWAVRKNKASIYEVGVKKQKYERVFTDSLERYILNKD